MKLKLNKLQCLKCGHIWVPRRPEVRQCTKCRTVFWDVKPENRYESKNKRSERDPVL